jgi:hypothetical protein
MCEVCQAHKSWLLKDTLNRCMWIRDTPIKCTQPLSINDLNCVCNAFANSTNHNDLWFMAWLTVGFFALLQLVFKGPVFFGFFLPFLELLKLLPNCESCHMKVGLLNSKFFRSGPVQTGKICCLEGPLSCDNFHSLAKALTVPKMAKKPKKTGPLNTTYEHLPMGWFVGASSLLP